MLVAVCVIVPVALVLFATRGDNGGSDRTGDPAVPTTALGLLPKNVVRPGDVAPRIVLNRLDGKGTVDTGDYRGKPYIVTFWASWCVPCRKEMPLLQKAYASRDGGLPVFGVAFQDAESDSRAFAKEHGITFPIARDDGVTYAQAYGVPSVPVTFFVGADGRVKDRVAGIESQSALDTPLGDLLGTG